MRDRPNGAGAQSLPRVPEYFAFKAADPTAVTRRLEAYGICHNAAQPVPAAQADLLAVSFFDRLKERCSPCTRGCSPT